MSDTISFLLPSQLDTAAFARWAVSAGLSQAGCRLEVSPTPEQCYSLVRLARNDSQSSAKDAVCAIRHLWYKDLTSRNMLKFFKRLSELLLDEIVPTIDEELFVFARVRRDGKLSGIVSLRAVGHNRKYVTAVRSWLLRYGPFSGIYPATTQEIIEYYTKEWVRTGRTGVYPPELQREEAFELSAVIGSIMPSLNADNSGDVITITFTDGRNYNYMDNATICALTDGHANAWSWSNDQQKLCLYGEDADLALDALLAYANAESHAVSVRKSTDSGESVDITKSVVK